MDIFSSAYAEEQDSQDPLRKFREDFIIPTRGQLKQNTLSARGTSDVDERPSTYLCGNSLGLQPRLTAQYTAAYHATWAAKGVYGHFVDVDDSPLVPWLHVDADAVKDMATVVGAQQEEVAVMQTLTANLHLAMCSFYRPTKERYKIIIEGKAFPSDHYAIESQIRHNNLDPVDAMILLAPSTPTKPTLSTSRILNVIDEHASSTALLLLPGIQFYTGQLFDIATITAHAQKAGIVVGWDLAHAVGNVPLHLHDWNVDFAAWCSYKYLNCGPGSIGGLFVHERHGRVDAGAGAGASSSITTTSTSSADSATTSSDANSIATLGYRPRLAGWWGSTKDSRFAMENRFTPITGAGGWQLSNPSVADMTAVRASLDVFKQTSMGALREKSRKLTGYLEKLLLADRPSGGAAAGVAAGKEYEIITPGNPDERGAQLSLRLAPGLLDSVMKTLEEEGVVVDERRPDVIRVAPAPLYNSFADVLRFVQVFGVAVESAVREKGGKSESASIAVSGGQSEKGWSEIK